MGETHKGWLAFWGWERKSLVWITLFLVALYAALFTGLFLKEGWTALWSLPALGGILMYPLTFGIVGRKMQKASQSLANEAGERADCIIVNGWLQSPAIALRTDTELVLRPIIGQTLRMPFTDLAKARETKWFNGSLYLGKTGYYFKEGIAASIGFAMANAVAARWRRLAQEAAAAREDGA